MNKNLLLSNTYTTRICGKCKEKIVLENELFQDDVCIIYFKEKAYHKSCFEKIFQSKRKLVEKDFDTIWNENIMPSKEHFWNIVAKNHLYKYLMKEYNITLFTNSFFQKMEQIYNGNWKNVSKPVRPEHLLDMFIQKRSYLEKQLSWKKLTGIEALNYSLAIIVNKYEDYLNWMEKSKEELKELEKFVQTQTLTNLITRNKETININILDDEE